MTNRVPFYRRRWVIAGAVIIAIPILFVAWWLVSPLFIDRVVDEPFPRAAMAVIPDDMTAEEVEEAMLEVEDMEVVVEEPMPHMPAPDAPAADATETTAAETTVAQETTTIAETTTTAPPAGPVLLYEGEFVDGDSFHTGSGDVKVYLLEDGATRILRMEDIEVKNGPDLHVYYTPAPTVNERGDVKQTGYLDLGGLKGNIGSQNYDLPADLELPDEFSIVVWCVPFQVVFASAAMRAP